MIVKTHRGPVEVEVGSPFTETIKRVATDLGLSSFRVFVGGTEVVNEATAPATIEEGMVVGLEPYDIAA